MVRFVCKRLLLLLLCSLVTNWHLSGGHSSALLLKRFSYPMPFLTMRTFLIPLIDQTNA